MTKLRLCSIAFLLLLAFTFFSVSTNSERSLERARHNGLRIGYAFEPPYSYSDSDGAVKGESPEIAKYISERLGVHCIEWVQTSFDNLITDLESGRFDVIAAGLFVTPERSSRVTFSRPTFRVSTSLLVAIDNPKMLKSVDDIIRQPSVQIAVLSGAVEGPRLRSCGVPNEQLLVVPDAVSGKSAVTSGIADGLALSSPTIRWMVKQDGAKVVEAVERFELPLYGPEFGAFAFRKVDRSLSEAWDRELQNFLGGEMHARIVAPLGFTEIELPFPAAAEGNVAE